MPPSLFLHCRMAPCCPAHFSSHPSPALPVDSLRQLARRSSFLTQRVPSIGANGVRHSAGIASVASTRPQSSSGATAAAGHAPVVRELPKNFDFASEERLFSWWESEGYFTPSLEKDGKPFVISMPPPNVTGALHMGHAMFVTLEDIMTRHWRMRGRPSLWLPGTAHAGITTQPVVKGLLVSEDVKRAEIGREDFTKRVWEGKNKFTIHSTHSRHLDVTSAFKERLSENLYRKRSKKGKGRGSQSSALPAKEAAQVVSAAQEKSVVVVESPAKAKTIEKYLGERHVVLPSFGHVRDLAAKSGSVRPDEDFRLVWEVPSSARQHLNAIKAAIKGASNLFLASDPDREGEAIAWHVLEMLKMEGAVHKTLKVNRVVFNEITKAAVLRAMEAPRDIRVALVDAYLARRALDYLIGFDLSPVLWRKLPGSKSAGRVQSAALRLICEREQEMEAFIAQEYWTIDTQFSLADKDTKLSTFGDGSQQKGNIFPAKVTHVDGEKLSQFSLATHQQAEAIAQRVETSIFSVCSVKKSVVRRNPLAPYITSTLQQDASTKLGFGATRTMAVAQQLYEGVKLGDGELTGLITYMRTDGVQLSGDAVQNIRTLIAQRYGEEYVPQNPRQFTSRVKNAQEAHEAIRPTDIHRVPSMLMNVLEEDALRLYSLIWRRTTACQMEAAIYAQVTVDILNDAEDLKLRASGSTLSFPGFLALKEKAVGAIADDGANESGEALSEGEDLQRLQAGDLLSIKSIQPNQHFTEAPPRYSEGSLVKKLEELGIGRPSTYASTLRTLQSRSYISIEKRRIFPVGRGRLVSAFLSHYFPRFSDYEFTAKLETQLDDVSAGREQWKNVLGNFWPDFHEGVVTVLKIPFEEVVNLLENAFAKQFFSGSTEKICPSCQEGKIGLKLSRFGSGYFLGCSRYPNCLYKTSILSPDGPDSSDEEEKLSTVGDAATKTIGVDPSSGLQVFMKTGPYGKYVQMGSPKTQKPKRTAIPKEMNADKITLDQALDLLKFPYELGSHPETNIPILISMGKYGPFLRYKGYFVSITKESIPTLTLEQALVLLNSKNVSKRGRKKLPDEILLKDDATTVDQAKDNKIATTKAKNRAASSAKKSVSVIAGDVEKVKTKASEYRKKSNKIPGYTRIVNGKKGDLLGDVNERHGDKIAGDVMEKQDDRVAGDFNERNGNKIAGDVKEKKDDRVSGDVKEEKGVKLVGDVKEKEGVKLAGDVKENEGDKLAGDVKVKKGNKLAGNDMAEDKIAEKGVSKGKENGPDISKRRRGRPRNVPSNDGEVSLAGVFSSITPLIKLVETGPPQPL